MIRSIAIALTLIPVQGWALSCLPHSVEAAFKRAAEAKETYVIVRGALEFDTEALPSADFARQNETAPMTHVQAVLRGKSLTEAGFSIPFDHRVTLAIACYGPWCAKPLSGSEVLAFVEQDEDGFVVATNPCGGYLFDTPKPAMIRKVKACFAGYDCVPEVR